MIIFGTSVTKKVGNQNVLHFPPHLNCASALPGETENLKSASFSLKWCMLFTKNTRNTLNYHLITAEPPFSVKTGCTRQDVESRCLLPTCCMLIKSVMVSVAV